MTAKRVGIDVDGIVADFNSKYKILIESNTDIRLPDVSDYYPNTWNYDVAAGLDPVKRKELWGLIKKSASFWRELPPYPETGEFLYHLENYIDGDVYFITNRPGASAKTQTELWLDRMGFYEPTVLISEEKGLCAKALNLTHYIDDKNENCADVLEKSPTTSTYMLARPWNQEIPGVPRIKSVITFLQEIGIEIEG